jgi:capsular exopolysaccharide synthesis family protein
MTFTALLIAIRRQVLLLLAGTLVGVLAAGGVLLFTPRSYASTASVYISATDTAANSQTAYQGTLLSQQMVKTYTGILVSDRVLQPVIDQFAPERSAADLASHVAVTADAESTLLRITIDDRSPRRAADLANSVTTSFIRVVGQLERPTVSGGLPLVSVDVVDRARPDSQAVSPRVWLDLAVGLVLGLLLGATAAVLRSASDSRLRTSAELGEAAGSPVLGNLPIDPGLKARGPLTGVPTGGYGEAVRRVRTNLLFADVDAPPQLLTVTSSVAEEGRTTLVIVLAAALAPVSRVAVVEGDLRRPSLAQRLGLSGSVGLTDVLSGRADLQGAMQRWADGVDVLVCGPVPHDPSELLSSAAMGRVFDRLRDSYDVVLIDAPPLGPVADAAVLAKRSDGAVLLCRAGATGRESVRTSVEALAAVGARLFGAVLTMTPARRRDRYRSSSPAAQATDLIPPSNVAPASRPAAQVPSAPRA